MVHGHAAATPMENPYRSCGADFNTGCTTRGAANDAEMNAYGKSGAPGWQNVVFVTVAAGGTAILIGTPPLFPSLLTHLLTVLEGGCGRMKVSLAAGSLPTTASPSSASLRTTRHWREFILLTLPLHRLLTHLRKGRRGV